MSSRTIRASKFVVFALTLTGLIACATRPAVFDIDKAVLPNFEDIRGEWVLESAGGLSLKDLSPQRRLEIARSAVVAEFNDCNRSVVDLLTYERGELVLAEDWIITAAGCRKDYEFGPAILNEAERTFGGKHTIRLSADGQWMNWSIDDGPVLLYRRSGDTDFPNMKAWPFPEREQGAYTDFAKSVTFAELEGEWTIERFTKSGQLIRPLPEDAQVARVVFEDDQTLFGATVIGQHVRYRIGCLGNMDFIEVSDDRLRLRPAPDFGNNHDIIVAGGACSDASTERQDELFRLFQDEPALRFREDGALVLYSDRRRLTLARK